MDESVSTEFWIRLTQILVKLGWMVGSRLLFLPFFQSAQIFATCWPCSGWTSTMTGSSWSSSCRPTPTTRASSHSRSSLSSSSSTRLDDFLLGWMVYRSCPGKSLQSYSQRVNAKKFEYSKFNVLNVQGSKIHLSSKIKPIHSFIQWSVLKRLKIDILNYLKLTTVEIF